MTDFIIIGIIAITVVISMYYIIKRKKEGKTACGSNCSSCGSTGCTFKKEK